MSVANRLYDRSHGFIGDVNASNPSALPVLYIDGKFPSSVVTASYEGRLQIHNAIGSCKVKLLTGDLPVGYTLSVDDATSEVVLKWPAFSSGVTTIPNANFEKGDDSSWSLGTGWSIMTGQTATDPNDSTGTHQAMFANATGKSVLMSNFKAPVNDTRSITASVDVQQGASSKNHAGAAVKLFFYDSFDIQLGESEGNVVKSGSDSDWHTSSVTAAVPFGTAYTKIAAAAFRNHQNRPLWVDNFTWNLSQPAQGTDVATTIALSLEVTDSDGRVADWSGSIIIRSKNITNWSTIAMGTGNQFSAFIDGDTIAIGAQTVVFYSIDRGVTWSNVQAHSVGLNIRGLVKYKNIWYAFGDYSGPTSGASTAPDVAGPWTDFSVPFSLIGAPEMCAFVENSFLYVPTTSTNYILHRYDGTTWTTINTGIAVRSSNDSIVNITQSGDVWLLGTQNGYLLRTSDFVTFTNVFSSNITNSITGVGKVGGTTILGTNDGFIHTSVDDGLTWDAGYSTGGTNNGGRNVMANGTVFISWYGNGVSTSTTGLAGSWTQRVTGNVNVGPGYTGPDLAIVTNGSGFFSAWLGTS